MKYSKSSTEDEKEEGAEEREEETYTKSDRERGREGE
jgi:hypothetical protein